MCFVGQGRHGEEFCDFQDCRSAVMTVAAGSDGLWDNVFIFAAGDTVSESITWCLVIHD